MNDYKLSQNQLAELKALHRFLRDKREADRVKAVLALARGWSSAQVAEILLFDEKTSRNYFERYQQGGKDALLDDDYKGADAKLDEHQLHKLEKYIDSHLFIDAKSVAEYIKKQYEISYSISGVTDLLHRLGFSYKKPVHTPGKQDPALQKEFVKKYKRLKREKGKNDPIYFADGTHPQHNSVPTYGWIKKGTDKELKANCGRQRLNINGAINIETLKAELGFYPTINADATLDLFLRIENKHPEANKIYIIVDNARTYHAHFLKERLRKTKIRIIFLPTYSPNLNLIERYWKFFKKKVLNNKYYETFKEFTKACENFFREQEKYLPELKTLLAENFHISKA